MGMRHAIAAVAGALLLFSTASASVVSIFSYSGEAAAGQSTATTNSFPAGGALRVQDTGSYAAAIGQGTANPFLYAAGAAAAGNSSATSNVLVRLEITNDTGAAANASLSGLIFAGAVGVANPNFSDPACSTTAIDACGVFFDGTPPLNIGESALVEYSATLDGASIFGGSIGVSNAGMSSSFTGVTLNNFGVNPLNGNLFSWDETTFSDLSLGVFAPNETKTLSFLVSAVVATNGMFGCSPATPFGCPLALAGFGDPPPGNGGVIIGGGAGLRAAGTASLAASTLNTTNNTPVNSGTGGLVIRPFSGNSSFLQVSFAPTSPPNTIPAPSAVYLFGLGIAGLAFSLGRRKKNG
ncbi:MAG: hypothetical protein R3C60_10910 [Parvularculaceae bacterium]